MSLDHHFKGQPIYREYNFRYNSKNAWRRYVKQIYFKSKMWVYQSFDVEVQTEGSLEICDMYMFLRCLLRVIRLGEKINAKPMQLNWMVRSQGKFENLIFHEKQIWNIQSVLMSSATLWRSKVFYYKSPIYYSLNILISPESFWFCNYSINLWWIIDKRLIFYCHLLSLNESPAKNNLNHANQSSQST